METENQDKTELRDILRTKRSRKKAKEIDVRAAQRSLFNYRASRLTRVFLFVRLFLLEGEQAQRGLKEKVASEKILKENTAPDPITGHATHAPPKRIKYSQPESKAIISSTHAPSGAASIVFVQSGGRGKNARF